MFLINNTWRSQAVSETIIYNNVKVTPELSFTIHYMSGVLKYERTFVVKPIKK